MLIVIYFTDEDDDVSGEASAKKSSESNASLDGNTCTIFYDICTVESQKSGHKKISTIQL